MRKLGIFILSGFGSGYLPIAHGTWGSAVIAAAFLAIIFGVNGDPVWIASAMGGIVVLSSVACIALGPLGEVEFGGKDPGQCVIDEWAGQALTFMLLPFGSGAGQWLIIGIAGFLGFRFFDILKPPPVRNVEALPRGWGVLADDLIAALYGNLTLQIIFRLILQWQ
ncbi:MAG: phosphatidylglycerophosphatase A [Phycisphaerae bacterium]